MEDDYTTMTNKQKTHTWKIRILIITIIAIGVFITSMFILSNVNHRQVIGTVDQKWVKQDGKSSKYLVYVNHENKCDTYEITDNLFYWRFDSSDVFGSLQEGQTYKFDIIGFRIPPFSTYPNIISVEPNSN